MRRPSNESTNTSVLEAGSVHEKVCSLGDCVIANIFDQSPQGNHLGQRDTTDGSGHRVVHKMVNASAHKIGVRGGLIRLLNVDLTPATAIAGILPAASRRTTSPSPSTQ